MKASFFSWETRDEGRGRAFFSEKEESESSLRGQCENSLRAAHILYYAFGGLRVRHVPRIWSSSIDLIGETPSIEVHVVFHP